MKNPDYQRRLEFALANQLWMSCSSNCVYDYDSYQTDNPLAFLWSGSCYDMNTKYCVENVDSMEWLHTHVKTLCGFGKACINVIEWTQEIAIENCPDGYGGSGDKGWGSARICPTLVRLDDGFYERAHILYAASFNRSLATHIFHSCSAKCVYDIENKGVSYQWTEGDCWKLQKDTGCINNNSMDYHWAFNYLNERICPNDIPPDSSSSCVERETEWTEEIAQAICSSNDMGTTNKGSTASVCAGFENYQWRLDDSLANRVFLKCDSKCVYDIYERGDAAFWWRDEKLCWKPVNSGSCFPENDIEKISNYINNVLCEEHEPSSPTPGPTSAPTTLCKPSPACIPDNVWDKDRAEELCPSVNTIDAPISYAVEVCGDSKSKMKQFSLFKSLANKFFHRCTSLCVYDYDTIMENIMYDRANQAGFQWYGKCWKWVNNGDCFSKSSDQYRGIYLHAQNLCNVTDLTTK